MQSITSRRNRMVGIECIGCIGATMGDALERCERVFAESCDGFFTEKP